MKKKFRNSIILALALITTTIFAYNLQSDEKAANDKVFEITSVEKGSKGKIIDFSFDKNGESKSFMDMAKGKVVFLNFWGTWCPPCRAEIPDIMKIQKEIGDKEILIVGVALEKSSTKDKLSKVSNFHSSNKLNYINFVDTENALASAYGGMRFVPTTLIINKNGEISEVIQGARSYDAFMESIKKVL